MCTFLISTQHQEDTSVMDIRPLVEAVMETAGKIKNDKFLQIPVCKSQ